MRIGYSIVDPDRETVPARCEHDRCGARAADARLGLCGLHVVQYHVDNGDSPAAYAAAEEHGYSERTVRRMLRDEADRLARASALPLPPRVPADMQLTVRPPRRAA